MKTRILGANQADLEVSALGLGCMGMSHQYGKAEEKDSLAVLNRALDLGVNFFDSSDSYGPYIKLLLPQSLDNNFYPMEQEKLMAIQNM